jgi:hypothetical protein
MTMKSATLMTAITTIALAALASPATAQPAYTLDGSTLTVTESDLVTIRGPEARLIAGTDVPAFANGAWAALPAGEDLVWELAPGTYAVTAFGDNDGVKGGEVSWEIVVDGPAPLTRLEQIRLAIFDLGHAIARLAALRPTMDEIERVRRDGGPLAHPTQAGPAHR